MAEAAPGATFGVDFICCQTRGCGKPSLSFLLAQNCRMLLSNAPNSPNPSKHAIPDLGAAKLRAVASQVFLFLFASKMPMLPSKPALGDGNYGLRQAKCFLFCCQTRSCGKPGLSFRLLELLKRALASQVATLGAVASQVFLFLLARNCQMLPSHASNPPNPSKRAKPALGAAKLEAVASQVFLFLLARHCRMLPSNASNPPKAPSPSKRAKPALGAAKLGAVASQVFQFLLARNCRMLPSNASNPPNPPNPSKRTKPAQVVWTSFAHIGHQKMGVGGTRALAPSIVVLLILRMAMNGTMFDSQLMTYSITGHQGIYSRKDQPRKETSQKFSTLRGSWALLVTAAVPTAKSPPLGSKASCRSKNRHASGETLLFRRCWPDLSV